MFDAVLDSCELTSSKCLLNLFLDNELLVIADAFQFFSAENIFYHGKNHFNWIELRRIDSIVDQSDIQLVCSGSDIWTPMTAKIVNKQSQWLISITASQ